MPQSIETTTETATAQKIAVGLMVATGVLVVVSVITSAIYTLLHRASSVTTTLPSVTTSSPATTDRILRIP